MNYGMDFGPYQLQIMKHVQWFLGAKLGFLHILSKPSGVDKLLSEIAVRSSKCFPICFHSEYALTQIFNNAC